MVSIMMEGKKINLENSEEQVVRYLESRGAKRVDPKVEGKSIEQLSLDPLTIAIITIGVGGYIWYKISKENLLELKETLSK